MRLLRNLRELTNSGAIRLEPYVIGIGLFIPLTLLAVWLGFAVRDGGELSDFDQTVALTMKDMGDQRPSKGKWMMAVTFLGGRAFLAGAAALVALWQLFRGKRWLGVAWCVIAVGGLGLNEGVKHAVARERPPASLRDPAVTNPPTNYSFPSGHALGSAVVFGLLGYTILLESKRRLITILVIAQTLLIVGAVGFSRVYLRVHWASDVLAGILIGAAWLALTLGLLESWRRGWSSLATCDK